MRHPFHREVRLRPIFLMSCAAVLICATDSASKGADGLSVPEGYVIEKVASEPGIRFPMFATFDDKGRLFVTESSGLDLYAELVAHTRKCRVSILEDSDGDGKFEKSAV